MVTSEQMVRLLYVTQVVNLFGSGLTNQNLDQVLAVGNTATNNIVLTGDFTQTGTITQTGGINLQVILLT